MRLDDYLNQKRVPFQRLPHETAYTAGRIAQKLHVPGKEMAKSILLRTGGGYALAVLPATCRVDFNRLQQDLGQRDVEMACEEEMAQLFPDCDPGAMPPFGSLYHMPTLVDESLSKDREIVFENQNHEEAIRMSYSDYEALENPRIGHFACR